MGGRTVSQTVDYEAVWNASLPLLGDLRAGFEVSLAESDPGGRLPPLVDRGPIEMCESKPGYRARRWGVERSHSSMNHFRRLRIRRAKKATDYLAFLHFSFAWSTLRSAKVPHRQ